MMPLAPAADRPLADATVMLLDTYGLVYRAFHALPALSRADGVRIEAAYGFTNTLIRVLADEKPTHVVACFDRGRPAARIERFPAYKAHRAATPDELRSQFALVRRILETYDIPVVELEGEEADDVIATLAREATAAGAAVDVLTGDLDLLQIVDERTTVLVTRRGVSDVGRYDPAAVRARYDLAPAQLPDYRGLKGDPSDNLPGIPGIGEKTASRLVRAAGSLDALLADPRLAGSAKLEKAVREHGEVARTCRDVSLIARDLPVRMPWEQARYRAPETDALHVLYRDLEFRSLLNRLPAPSAAVAAEDPGEMLAGAYTSFVHATDPADFAALAARLGELAGAERLALARRGEDELGLCGTPGTGLAFREAALADEAVAHALRTLLARTPLVVHDAKALGKRLPLEHARLVDDTMIAAHLLDPARTFARLDDAAREFLAVGVPDDAAAFADATRQLALVARDHLAHREQLGLYEDLELPLVSILAGMERAGIGVDVAALVDLAAEVDAAVLRLQDEIHALAGAPFAIGSPQQLGRVLFETLGIAGGTRNKIGWATGADMLQRIADEHPIARKVLEWREVVKLKNTYIDAIPKLVDPADRRLRTVFNQTATATGRLSSTNPNLQNIPVRGDLGRRVRRAFTAGPKRLLLAADYSQIELRIMAHLSGDAAMREAFSRGEDIHDVTARGIFGTDAAAQSTANERRIAKSVNFGLLYGMSDFGLAQRLGIDRALARAMTEAYFARFPSVRAFIDRTIEQGRERGYVETILGRRRYLPDLRSRNGTLRSAAEREATNAPMQGSAADLVKLAMVRIDRALDASGADAAMLLQIHDELIFEAAAAEMPAVATLVRAEMERAYALAVPLEATLKIGRSWYDAEIYDLPAESAS